MRAFCRHRSAGTLVPAAVVMVDDRDHPIERSLRRVRDVCRERRRLCAAWRRGSVRRRVAAHGTCAGRTSDAFVEHRTACWGEGASDRALRAPAGNAAPHARECEAEGVSCDTGETAAEYAARDRSSKNAARRERPGAARTAQHEATKRLGVPIIRPVSRDARKTSAPLSMHERGRWKPWRHLPSHLPLFRNSYGGPTSATREWFVDETLTRFTDRCERSCERAFAPPVHLIHRSNETERAPRSVDQRQPSHAPTCC